jgi:diguanylate cyclase (GGDEF)-like protein
MGTRPHAGRTDPVLREHLLLDCVADAIVVVTEELEATYLNQAAREMAETTDPAASDVDAISMLHPDDIPEAAAAVQRAVEQGSAVTRVRVRLPSGLLPVEITLTNHLRTPNVEGIVACFRNLEHEEALREALRRQRDLDQTIMQALTDELTGLPTRRLFLERLDEALRDCRHLRQSLAVLFIDLDGFKNINDALGHTAGDAMLRSTTERLLVAHPASDNWARIGGDEFAVFVANSGADRARRLAADLAEALRRVVVLGGRPFHTSASIGISVIGPDHAIDAETAVRRADIAMFEGKRTGTDSITLFYPEMESRVVMRTELEGQLRSTLIGAGPDVVFQPIIHLGSGRTVGVEALARWHSPTHGPIGPDRFVPMAERIGVVDQLDRHVIRKACRAIRGLREPHTGLNLDLSVNASTVHLAKRTVAEDLLSTLDGEGFPASRLILEVTESRAVEDDAPLREQLRRLRAEGVRVALDDFGTGHSSLAQLETLPVDIVKIDRSFIHDVPESSRRLRYLETVIALATALELDVICEGIERPAQATALADLGVRLGQGYLLAEPVGAGELDRRMTAAGETLAQLEGGIAVAPTLPWAEPMS